MLHAGEKWAAVEYSTSPPQDEEEEEEVEEVEGWREVVVCMCVEERGGWRGGSNDAFPSPQVERITITIKNQKACVSIKQLPITLCVPTAK